MVRERGGNSVPAVSIRKARPSLSFARIAKGTTVHAGDAAARDDTHERFEVKGINHQETHGLDGACTVLAEEYVCRLYRSEIRIHDRSDRSHLRRYAQA
jgi:hypothetical protein